MLSDIDAEICHDLAGRAAETLIFGEASTGAGGPVDSDLALAIETAWGLGELGPAWVPTLSGCWTTWSVKIASINRSGAAITGLEKSSVSVWLPATLADKDGSSSIKKTNGVSFLTQQTKAESACVLAKMAQA